MTKMSLQADEQIELAQERVLQAAVKLNASEAVEARELADLLEVWIAAVLSQHPRWVRPGRWFDGLLIDSFSAEESALCVSGRVFILSHDDQLSFTTVISLGEHPRTFELEVSDPESSQPLSIRRALHRQPFPLHTWGSVEGHEQVRAVRVDETPDNHFLLVTDQPSGTFDTWLESEDDVIDALSEMRVHWQTLELR